MPNPEIEIGKSLGNFANRLAAILDFLHDKWGWKDSWFEGYTLAVTANATAQPFDLAHLVETNKRQTTYVKSVQVAASAFTAEDKFGILLKSTPIADSVPYLAAVTLKFTKPKIITAETGTDTILRLVWTNKAAQAKTLSVIVERMIK
jgi:hypothetical protein